MLEAIQVAIKTFADIFYITKKIQFYIIVPIFIIIEQALWFGISKFHPVELTAEEKQKVHFLERYPRYGLTAISLLMLLYCLPYDSLDHLYMPSVLVYAYSLCLAVLSIHYIRLLLKRFVFHTYQPPAKVEPADSAQPPAPGEAGHDERPGNK